MLCRTCWEGNSVATGHCVCDRLTLKSDTEMHHFVMACALSYCFDVCASTAVVVSYWAWPSASVREIEGFQYGSLELQKFRFCLNCVFYIRGPAFVRF